MEKQVTITILINTLCDKCKNCNYYEENGGICEGEFDEEETELTFNN